MRPLADKFISKPTCLFNFSNWKEFISGGIHCNFDISLIQHEFQGDLQNFVKKPLVVDFNL